MVMKLLLLLTKVNPNMTLVACQWILYLVSILLGIGREFNTHSMLKGNFIL